MNLEIWIVEVFRDGDWQFRGARQTAASARALTDEMSGTTHSWYGNEIYGEQTTISRIGDPDSHTYHILRYVVKP